MDENTVQPAHLSSINTEAYYGWEPAASIFTYKITLGEHSSDSWLIELIKICILYMFDNSKDGWKHKDFQLKNVCLLVKDTFINILTVL